MIIIFGSFLIILFGYMFSNVELHLGKIDLRWIFILLIIISVISFPIINNTVCSTQYEDITKLYAGYNGLETNGSFFLGSGSIEEVDMVYYWVDNDGIKSKHSERMGNSVFIEDGKNIMAKKYNGCPSGWNWFFIESSFGKVEFHVPEGSIAQMYGYK